MAGVIQFIQLTDIHGACFTVNVNHIIRLQRNMVYIDDQCWILLDKDSFGRLQAFLNPQGHSFGEEIK